NPGRRVTLRQPLRDYIFWQKTKRGEKGKPKARWGITLPPRRINKGVTAICDDAPLFSAYFASQPIDSALLDAAVDTFRSQVRRLIREPDTLPFIFDLTQIFGGVEQFVHPTIRVAGVNIE